MIFVTLGTHRTPFPRLAEWMEAWAGAHDEEVVIQCGFTPFDAEHARVIPFMTPAEVEAHVRRARWVVGHAGVGTILGALMQDRPIVVVPRRADAGEHLDAHQEELAARMQSMGLVWVAHDEATLQDMLETDVEAPRLPGRGELVAHLAERVQALDQARS